MSLDFIHLHLHSEYSLKDGLVRIDSLVEKATKLGMPALALTDYMNLFAVIKFYQACEGQGIKPVVGAELAILNEQNPQQPHSLIALCQNDTGYHHLRLLLSKAYREGQQAGFAQIQREWLYQWNEGLILLSDARAGDIAQALMADNLDAARELAKTWAERFPNRFYLEVQRTGRSKEDTYLHHALQLAQDFVFPW